VRRCRLVFLFYIPLCTWAAPAPPVDAEQGAALARSIQDAGFDPEECYRIRDLTLQKEDIRLYLTDGYLIFSKPVAGEPRSALFTAEVEGGDGEVILLPPQRGERQSLAMFTQSPNLDEHIRTAMLIFTDGSGRLLRDRILKEGAGRKAGEMGALLASQWTPVLANIGAGFQMRLVADILAPPRAPGMLFLALSGRQLGNFDILYDPYSREQIMAGQLAEHSGKLAYNIWTSFPARSSRTGASKVPDPWFTLENFRINAAVAADLHMKATTRATARIGANPVRVFPLTISHAMKVTSARIDGAPAEVFVQDSIRGRALRSDDNDTFLLVAPDALAAQSEHEIELEHEGAVIVPAGNGVFYVGSRSTWYPGSGGGFATYDLTFRYPKSLTLVSAGDLAEDHTDGDWRITRWHTPAPIRQAGFNLGEYEKASGSAAGYTVQVYGNRHLESALQQHPPAEPVLPPTRPVRRPGHSLNTTDPPAEAHPDPDPDPLARLRSVAADVSSSLEFFSVRFGPAALKTLTVAPIPATFGQGFPGLVYLSTLSYLDPRELRQAIRLQQRHLLAWDLMESHEVAHQWWGNVVTADSPQDVWLMEALANYSGLLWMEKTKGTKTVESLLDDYRDHLTAKDSLGRTIESAGPIVWGDRLDSTGVADAWRVITYEKGAWILHMLRRRMGDDRFFKMLAELRRRYEFRPVSTRDFQALVKEFHPPDAKSDTIDDFFDNWIYATGVPSLKVQYSVKGVAPDVKVSGTLAQSGVEDDFSVEVPIEIQFAKGASRTLWVPSSNEAVPFSVSLRQAPVRVGVSAGFLVTKK
jgi:hypothetical protein